MILWQCCSDISREMNGKQDAMQGLWSVSNGARNRCCPVQNVPLQSSCRVTTRQPHARQREEAKRRALESREEDHPYKAGSSSVSFTVCIEEHAGETRKGRRKIIAPDGQCPILEGMKLFGMGRSSGLVWLEES